MKISKLHCARTFELDVDCVRSTLSRVVTGKLNGRTTTGPCRSFNAMMLRGFPGPNISHFYRLFLFSRESQQTASTTNRKVSVSTTHDILPRIAFQRKRPERDGFRHGRISVSVMRHACWKRNIVDHSPPVNFPMSSWVLI